MTLNVIMLHIFMMSRLILPIQELFTLFCEHARPNFRGDVKKYMTEILQ